LEGWPSAGKSTLARRLADQLRETGIPVCGFVTEEIREGGRRRGFSLERLGGERGVLDTLKRRSGIKTLRLTRANRDDLPKAVADRLRSAR
jgi:nucleoside-triphosphatase THEP1